MSIQLSHQQVQDIENRLSTNGLTYWDIRIELLDHIVSMIEEKMAKGESYESALENTFYTLDYNKDLSELNKRRLLGINTIVRKQYFNQIKLFFTRPTSLVLIISILVFYTLIYQNASRSIFKWVSVIALMTPIVLGVFLYFKEFLQKQKSAYLVYSSFYIFFSFMLLNVFLQFFTPEGIFPVSKETQYLIWFIVTTINGISSAAGINIHLVTRKRIKSTEMKLKSL